MKNSSGKKFVAPVLLALLVVIVWAFPKVWYRVGATGPTRWWSERTEVPGWAYRAIPVDESAEKALVADRTINGVFTNAAGTQIHVFSAKRYEEKSNEIGLFIHTPDRCWVEIGWKLEAAAAPNYKEMDLHGARVQVERRIYNYQGRRELVYFFGLQRGSALPYRLDHYLSTAQRSSDQGTAPGIARASDWHFWRRLWDSFEGRREFLGPKQFIRISTGVMAEEETEADRRLENFLHQWLVPADYDREKSEWKMARAASPAKEVQP